MHLYHHLKKLMISATGQWPNCYKPLRGQRGRKEIRQPLYLRADGGGDEKLPNRTKDATTLRCLETRSLLKGNGRETLAKYPLKQMTKCKYPATNNKLFSSKFTNCAQDNPLNMKKKSKPDPKTSTDVQKVKQPLIRASKS